MKQISNNSDLRLLSAKEVDMVSGGVLPVLLVYAAYSFVAGLTAGLSAAGVAAAMD